MSINDQLPREVESAARALCDDKHFVGSVWKVLAGYHDLRSMECDTTPKEQRRQDAQELVQALRKLRGARTKMGSDPLHKIDQALEDAERDYNECLSAMDADDARATQNKSLRWLAGSMLNVFDTYGVSDRKLSGFLETALPVITDTAPPSRRAIQTAIKEKRT